MNETHGTALNEKILQNTVVHKNTTVNTVVFTVVFAVVYCSIYS